MRGAEAWFARSPSWHSHTASSVVRNGTVGAYRTGTGNGGTGDEYIGSACRDAGWLWHNCRS